MSSGTISIPAAQTAPETQHADQLKTCVDRLLATEARVPVATYRVQVHKDFNFADVRRILDYLRQLGISDLYSSPIFEARPGSTHGYDVIDHERLNPELGGEEGFASLSEDLRKRSMGLLLDIVPNHMGIGAHSAWWRDILENGQASEYAEFFDIDWAPLKEDMRGKLLLPILGSQYGEELENGNIKLTFDGIQLAVRYYSNSFPVTPRSVPSLFPEEMRSRLSLSLRGLLRELEDLPPHDSTDPIQQQRRRELLVDLRPQLFSVLSAEENKAAVEAAVAAVNGKPGDPPSFDRLHSILEAQPYRLAFWRVSSEEINYRRFFDVNDLVGLRMENPRVFAATHARIRALLATGQLTGLRIDHCDGMFNPRQYLIRLQMLYIASQCCGPAATGELAPNGIELAIHQTLRGFDWAASHGPLYTVVEKILEPREYLPAEWPVRGTSGYDFVYTSTQLFIQSKSEKQFDRIYTRYISEHLDPDEVVYRSKLMVMQASLASEVFTLANLLSRIAAANRRARDFTDSILEAVIRETIACFPVYRTYIDDRGQYTDRDRTYIRAGIAKAKRMNPEIAASAFDFLRDTLLLGGTHGIPEDEAGRQQLHFALKFQQFTGPVMAKGVEDTTFYRYNRFLSANEVGGSIKDFGMDIGTLHAGNEERLSHARDAMLATSTHDTKRSEDVRARLNVLSEMPSDWASFLARVTRLNRRFKRTLEDGRVVPDANEEYLLYQTILGAWPWQPSENFVGRIQQYMTKALSEAKINLSWINPDPAYVEAAHAFIADILAPKSRFVETVNKFIDPLRMFGAVNSLAQTLLKMTIPGVPDIYQGMELWEFSLVDPDNRRPVNYDLRTRFLADLQERCAKGNLVTLCRDLLASLEDGRSKMWVIHRALEFRGRNPALFRDGAYTPLRASGNKQEHVVAYQRSHEGKNVIVAVPRFAATLMRKETRLPLGAAWGDTVLCLPAAVPTSYRNIFTGETLTVSPQGLKLSNIFGEFPVAMLVSD